MQFTVSSLYDCNLLSFLRIEESWNIEDSLQIDDTHMLYFSHLRSVF